MNAKQILISTQNELQDEDDITVVITRKDKVDGLVYTLVSTSIESFNEKLGALENTKIVMWEGN
ncbi:hypothetical protein FH181_02710 [Staphylococcus warneri]|uniref:hypothetical protein n=1 Tax=Staphylococcus warneri TaxID=1292 RepID=UPI001F590729|nr:hypothetical protein [Staphylococcus warneri]MCI2770676.1 hypothetical protein [Staphylococcus warneri]MCI2783395.1 hypothetical protein [Staphylococcus warneri]